MSDEDRKMSVCGILFLTKFHLGFFYAGQNIIGAAF